MVNAETYINEMETTLGIKFPLKEGAQAVYEAIYTALAKQYGVEKIDTGVDFSAYRPEELIKEHLNGRVVDGFTYTPFIVIDTKSRMYQLIKEANFDKNNNVEVVYRNIKEFSDAVAICKDGSKLLGIIAIFGLVVVCTAAAVFAVAAAIATGGLALPIIAAVLSGVAAVITFLISLFSMERVFTGLVLNDSNKDAYLKLSDGDVYANEGKVTLLPGDMETKKTFIPKKAKDGNVEYAAAGIFQVYQPGSLPWRGGAECLLRFKFDNLRPRDIDILGACPWLRQAATGIAHISENRYTVEAAFKSLIDKRKATMRLDPKVDGVNGFATVDGVWGKNTKGIAWVEFTK